MMKPEAVAVLLCIVNTPACAFHRHFKITTLITKLVISLHVLVAWKLLSLELYFSQNGLNTCLVSPLETWEASLPASFPVSSSSAVGVCPICLLAPTLPHHHICSQALIISLQDHDSRLLSGIVVATTDTQSCGHIAGMSKGRVSADTTLVGS